MERQSTDEILLEYGVHLGFGENRQELARSLERGELTGGDLRMVCDHVKDQSTPKAQGARIASVLQDKDRWGPLLADLRKFHELRHRNAARMEKKKKQEPGKGLRDQDQAQRDTGTAAHFEITPDELSIFKWRWTVADYRHRGHSVESVEQNMNASPAEQDICLGRFPTSLELNEALAEYAGPNKGKTNASNPGTD